MPVANIDAYIDGFIDFKDPNANFNCALCAERTIVKIGLTFSGSKSHLFRAIGEFDVSALAGNVINTAKLRIFLHDFENPELCAASIVRCTRPGDWVESQVTWNSYATGLAWTSGGGDFDAATPPAVSFTVQDATGWQEISGIEGFVTDALANRAGLVSVIVKLDDEDLTPQHFARWRSREFSPPGNTWELEIDYTDAGAGLTPLPLRDALQRLPGRRPRAPRQASTPAQPSRGRRPAQPRRPR